MGPAQREGSAHSSLSSQAARPVAPPGPGPRGDSPRVLHGLQPWHPPAVGKTLISAIAGDLTLNFVVDKGHGKGRCRSLACRENRSFGSGCILFQSGSSKKVAMQCVCVYLCMQNYCRTEYMGLYLLTSLMTTEGFPHTCYFCAISKPNPTRCSLCTRVPSGSSKGQPTAMGFSILQRSVIPPMDST